MNAGEPASGVVLRVRLGGLLRGGVATVMGLASHHSRNMGSSFALKYPKG
jgi:hypothetical protein